MEAYPAFLPEPPKMLYTQQELDGIHSLCVFYTFPRELVEPFPEFMRIPRIPANIIRDPAWLAVINSDRFYRYMQSMVVALLWHGYEPRRNIDIKEYGEGSAQFPMMSHIAADCMELVVGAHSPRELMLFGGFEEETFPTMQGALHAYHSYYPLVVDCYYNHRRVMEYLNEHRCFEDFKRRSGIAYIDFYRKWYNTRALTSAYFWGSGIHDMRDNAWHTDSEDARCTAIDFDGFVATLNADEKMLLKLCMQKLPLSKMAAMLGLKTQSAVSKRRYNLNVKLSEWLGIDPPQKRKEQVKLFEERRKTLKKRRMTETETNDRRKLLRAQEKQMIRLMAKLEERESIYIDAVVDDDESDPDYFERY